MAYERTAIKNELKMNLNYGEVGDKIKKKLKTIGGVTTDGTAAITGVIVKNGKVLKAHVEV